MLGSVTPDKDVIPLCTCKISGASFQKMTTIVTFCQALDSVDGKVLGCCNKVTNPQLVRPAVKIPFLALCDSHRKRLRLHQCCPGCGHFCTQVCYLFVLVESRCTCSKQYCQLMQKKPRKVKLFELVEFCLLHCILTLIVELFHTKMRN